MKNENIPKIVEAEWEGKVTYCIHYQGKALWKISSEENGEESKPIWTNRLELAWHTGDLAYAKLVLEEYL